MNGVRGQQHYLSIHYLRAVAALMVVAVHCFTYGLVPVDDPARVLWLKHGVALFFVISGFVMVKSTEGREVTPGQFMLRRLIRIVPLYWAMTLAWATVSEDWDMGQLAASLAFVPGLDPATGATRSPVLEPGWTLNYEMFFYALFALSLWLSARWRLWSVGALLAGAVLARQVLPLGPLGLFYSNALLLLFVGGMAIARFDLRLPALFVPAGFAALALLSQQPGIGAPAVYLSSLAVVLGARSLDGRLPHWRLPSRLADASYAIYLSHLFVVQLADRFVAPAAPGPVTLLVVLAGACWFGLMVHRTLELPLSDMLRRRLRSRTAQAGAPASA